jgi:uncharacterized DUF497 family protein
MSHGAEENRLIAEQLRELAGLLQAQGANPFRVSNTAQAHRLGRTRDWVVVYFYDKDHVEGQYTIVTESRGVLGGKRVVRAREAECREHYQ